MHDADELCDRVAFLVEGELKLVGRPDELKRQYGQKTVDVIVTGNSKDKQSASHQFSLDGLGTNQALLDLLNSATIESIHSQEATLEEVFIQSTGISLL